MIYVPIVIMFLLLAFIVWRGVNDHFDTQRKLWEIRVEMALAERDDLAQFILASARRDARMYHEVTQRRDVMALADRAVHGTTLDEAMENGQ